MVANSILIAVIFIVSRVVGEKNRSVIENLEIWIKQSKRLRQNDINIAMGRSGNFTRQNNTNLKIEYSVNLPSVFIADAQKVEKQDNIMPTMESIGNLPSVFIVGAQKGGSSSLFELMIEHPLICRGKRKESHYFNFETEGVYSKGIDFYKQMFIDKKCNGKNGTFYVDGTPILHQDDRNGESVWQRIYDTYSFSTLLRDDLKFIALLREPVSRDYSWFQHNTRADLEKGGLFSDILTMSEKNKHRTWDDRIIYTYVHQLMNFAKIFKRSQILVISSTDIFTNTASVMERIRMFLNVPSDPSFSQTLPHDDHLDHAAKKGPAFVQCLIDHVPKLDCLERDRLGDFYEKYNQELYEFLKNGAVGKANPNETPFWPQFDSHKGLPCSNDTRKEMDAFLELDKLKGSKC